MTWRPRHGWQAIDDEERCEALERRWVNEKKRPSVFGQRTVRCARFRGHDGEHSWRRRRFGVATVPEQERDDR